jgi:hypothetical protein
MASVAAGADVGTAVDTTTEAPHGHGCHCVGK